MPDSDISSGFPFELNCVNIDGSDIHYIDEGSGDPILFLHGNPTSSYLWRNIIPHLSQNARCIAPDLIGMGKSDKPELDYRFKDHYRYIKRFIEELGLKQITLVLHDWGSGIGFHYTVNHPENVKGIAFMEAIIDTARWEHFPKKFKIGFKIFRTPVLGCFMISVMNVFVEKILPEAIVRTLSEEEMEYYRAPFQTIRSRKPIRVWPREIPIDGQPADMHQLVKNYNKKLQEIHIPKLLFYAHPGGIIREKQVQWCKNHLTNLKTIDLGKGIHYLQEDHPHQIGQELAEWYKDL